MGSIRENIEEVRGNIAAAALRSGRKPEDVKLLAVTKTVGIDRIEEAYEAGLYEFGENRVQEIMAKYEFFSKKAKFHLIGQLQKNKVKYIIDKVELVHSISLLPVALEIERLCEKNDTFLDCLIQVNTSREDSKSGVLEEDLDRFVDDLAPLERLHVKGLMTIGAYDAQGEQARKYFVKTRELYEKLSAVKRDNFSMEHLSMGMTSDYEVAIEEGADIVRVGSAIFGSRA